MRDGELSALRSLLKGNGIYPKKRLGQTFLFKRCIAEEIVTLADITPDDLVVEIGPGTGVLTHGLAERGAPVVCLEYDIALVELLAQTMADPRVTVIRADALTYDYTELYRQHGKRLTIIGNLPYYLTSPLIFKLLGLRALCKSILVMTQKELAERIVAQPGTHDYGTITIFSQLYSDVSRVLTVTRDYFYPQPQVDSEVLSFSIRTKPLVEVGNAHFFERLVRASFSQRRKTILNALKGSNYLNRGRERIVDGLKRSGIDPMRRPETVSIAEFGRLSNLITED